MSWICEHAYDLAVGAVILICLALIARKLILDRKKGRKGCGDCAGCAYRNDCEHQKTGKEG